MNYASVWPAPSKRTCSDSEEMDDNTVLNFHAARDVSQRSRAGTIYYVIIFIIIAVMTPYFREHPWFMSVMGGLVVAGTVVRGVCVWLFERTYSEINNYWYIAFTTAIFTQALAWSMAGESNSGWAAVSM